MLKLRWESEREFIIHLQPFTFWRKSFSHQKSKDGLSYFSNSVIELLKVLSVKEPFSATSQQVLKKKKKKNRIFSDSQALFSSTILATRTGTKKKRKKEEAWQYPRISPQSGSKKFDTSLSAFQESQRGEDGLTCCTRERQREWEKKKLQTVRF